jgi:hypothetical protein
MGCVVALPGEHSMRSLAGDVRSGQSDIEAMSGAELVRTRKRRPHMLAFQPKSTCHVPLATPDGPRPTLTTSDAQPDVPSNESPDYLDETITGRTRPVTPQRASESRAVTNRHH